jgi:hypothetical protein
VITLLLALISGVYSNAQVTTAEAFCAQLSHQLGKPVQISGPIKEDLVFVEPHGASPQSVLSALAVAIGAKLEADGSGYKLMRTKDWASQISAQVITERTKWLERRLNLDHDFRAVNPSAGLDGFAGVSAVLQKSVAMRAGKLDHMGPFSGAELLPSSTLLESLLSRIGLKQLASLPAGEVAVYEDAPASGEQSLPEHQDLTTVYESELNNLRAQPLPDDLRRLTQLNGMAGVFADLESTRSLAKLRLTEIASTAGFQFLLEGLDQTGSCFLHTGCFAGGVDELLSGPYLMRRLSKSRVPRRVDLSQASLDFIRRLKESPTQWPEWLLAPDKFEPLNAFAAEALQKVAAESPGKAVVIFATDSLWSEVLQSVEGDRLNLDVLEALMNEESSYRQVEVDGSSICWKPSDLVAFESRRANRKELARFADRVRRDHFVAIESAVRLYSDASLELGPLPNVWCQNVQRCLGTPGVRSDRSNDIYRLLGGLREDIQESAREAQDATCDQLRITQQAATFLRRDISLTTEGPSVSDLLRHPPEALNGAAIGDAFLHIEVTPTLMVGARDETPGRAEHWYPLTDFEQNFPVRSGVRVVTEGGVVKVATSEQEFESSNAAWHYRAGDREDLVIRIYRPNGLFVSGHVEGGVSPSGQELSYRELPQQVKDSIWASICKRAIEVARQMQNQPAFGQGAPTISPPPAAKP